MGIRRRSDSGMRQSGGEDNRQRRAHRRRCLPASRISVHRRYGEPPVRFGYGSNFDRAESNRIRRTFLAIAGAVEA